MDNRLLVARQSASAGGLLDLVPGAAAAYSLRSLSSTYTDPVVTVRRSSDNAEDSFTASEVSDGTLAAFCGVGDGFVKQWWDQSGNARHASQTAAASQPKIVSGGVVVTEDGKPSLSFDGAGDELATPAFSTEIAASVFIVGKADAWHSGADYECFFSHGYATGTSLTKGIVVGYLPNAAFSGWAPGDIVSFGSGYESAPKAVGPIQAGSDLRLVAAILSASTASHHVNGALVPATTSTTGNIASLTAPVLLGSARAGVVVDMLAGTISEVIYYTSDQTANRELIEGNIAWSYS